MTRDIKQTIKDILTGKTEPEDALDFLKKNSWQELEALFDKEEFDDLFAGYSARNTKLGILPDLSKAKEDALWERITDGGKASQPVQPAPGFVDMVLGLFSRLFTVNPGLRYGMLTVCLLMLLVIPVVVFQTAKDTTPMYYAMKGTGTKTGFSFEIATLVEGNKLVRPVMPLTEDDVIALQLSTDHEGYYSFYVLYGKTMDTVVLDTYTTAGTHVVDTVYNPRGNKGDNILVMQFNRKMVTLNDKERETIIRKAAGKKLPEIRLKNFIRYFNYVVHTGAFYCICRSQGGYKKNKSVYH